MPFDTAPQSPTAWFILAIESVGPADPSRVTVGTEWAVRRRLRRANIEHYLPIEEIRSVRRGGAKANPRLVPFLPGYVFVRGNLNVLQSMLEGEDRIKGSMKLLRGAEPHPRPVPAQAIQAFQSLEDKDGKIRIHRAAAQRFKKGAKVRAVAGLAQGYLGEVLSLAPQERIKVLFPGNSVPWEVEASDVVAA